MTWVARDLSGQIFFRLRVVGKAGMRDTHTYWECICECGTRKVVRGSALTEGKAKSCGCYRVDAVDATNKSRRHPDPWLAEMNTYVCRLGYDREKRRKLAKTWGLSLVEYKVLSTSECYYCGTPPSSPAGTKILRDLGVLRNGIDRVDNTKGYESGNCVTSCCVCNREKGTRTLAEFLETTRRRYLHLKDKGLL